MINILNQAIKENNYEELNKVVQNIEIMKTNLLHQIAKASKISAQIN
ncbi:hypothetical protein IHO40_00315 [Wolbachia endosymbiont of Mansonella ozzardi]|nr:hypothetical protein [Wolbachia endosymbiont of Mansonella ozzardi]MCA4774633.1 hypothetical protein [Wolbachia endosymbiont of Mansonella ozzardi]